MMVNKNRGMSEEVDRDRQPCRNLTSICSERPIKLVLMDNPYTAEIINYFYVSSF